MSIFNSNKYPKTAKYEAKIQQSEADSERFKAYQRSEELKRVNELEQLIKSDDFKTKVEKLKSEKFKDTSEFNKLKEYNKLKKSSEFKKYFKYKNSRKPERIAKVENSEKRMEFISLKDHINSGDFQVARNSKDFKKSDSYGKYKKYNSLRKDSDIRFYEKQINSSDYNNYQNIHNSNRLKNLEDLEQEVTSEKFISFKKYMEDSKKFQKSEEHALIKELESLVKSKNYTWHQKALKDDYYKDIDKWELTFEDNFDTNQLNSEKWITGYYWGKALLNKVYVLENEKQFFKDNNVKISNNRALLSTKNEATKGLVWDSKHGFIPKGFNYTSALINTGQSQRQLYGKFEAKVKVDHAYPVNHAFWMVGEKIAPQIDIFRFNSKSAQSFTTGTYTPGNNQSKNLSKKINGAEFDSDYYIYSLEWTKEKLAWFVNGIKVHEQSDNIPDEPMYMVFSSHITSDIKELNKQANIHIDWVKCYKEKK